VLQATRITLCLLWAQRIERLIEQVQDLEDRLARDVIQWKGARSTKCL
jgi:TolB-like protein